LVEVLLADDTEETWFLVKRALGEQFHVTCVPTVAAATLALQSRHFDLLLLDISLPDGEGFQICAQVRNAEETKNVPVIFLTGRNDIGNLLTGFSLGADDYIEKPFDPRELNARVKAKLNRMRMVKESDNLLSKNRLRLQLLRQRVSIAEGNLETEIELKPIEFKLLLYLMQNEEMVLSRQQLLNAVWGNATFIVDRTVDKHICSLRQKLATCSHYIQTVPSFGYKFSSQAKAQSSQEAADLEAAGRAATPVAGAS
jgi:DNA-binding response OmpR family regulator